jgi:ribosomal protein L1
MITNIPNNSIAFLRSHFATSKKILFAIAAAAACAGIVVLAPELGPKSAMAATQSGESGALTQAVVGMKEKGQSDGGCSQHWPYYEQSCLHDARLPNGVERVVRVIAIGRAGEH